MRMRFRPLWLLPLAALFAVPAPTLAQESSSKKAVENDGVSKGEKKTKKSRRSFKRMDSDEARPAPSTTENTLTVTPNIPGGEDDTLARGKGERPNTD